MRWLLVIPLILALLPLVMSPAEAGIIEITKVVWGSLENPVTVGPGDSDVKLLIVFTHLDTDTDIICAIQAWLKSPPASEFPFTNWNGDPTIDTLLLNRVRLGESAVLEFTVDVLDNARPGTYMADLIISYRDCTSDNLPISRYARQVQLVVSEPLEPRFLRAKWMQNGVEVPVGPGSGVADLVLWFEVPRDLTISNVLGELVVNGEVVKDSFLGTVGSGGSFSLSFPVSLTYIGQVGSHEFHVYLSYRNQWNTLRNNSYTIVVDVKGREDLHIEQSPATFSKGSHASIYSTIINSGTAAANKLKITLNSPSGTLRVLKNIYELNVLEPGGSVSFTIPVYVDPSSPTGPITIAVSATYQDVLGIERVKEHQLVVNVSDLLRPGFTVRLGRSLYNASTIDEITIEYVNLNKFSVTDVKISVSPAGTPLTFIGEDLSRYVAVMKPLETHTFKYRVVIPSTAADSAYIIRTSVEYKDEIGQTRVESFEIPVAVRGDIKIMLRNLQHSPEIVRPGESVDVVGDVVNSGSTVARSVLVELLGDKPFLETVDSSSFIGLINPSQVSAITLAFKVDEDARPGIYTAILKVSYKNGLGEEYALTQLIRYRVETSSDVTTTVTRPSENNLQQQLVSPTLIAFIAAAAIAGFLIGRGVRKR